MLLIGFDHIRDELDTLWDRLWGILLLLMILGLPFSPGNLLLKTVLEATLSRGESWIAVPILCSTLGLAILIARRSFTSEPLQSDLDNRSAISLYLPETIVFLVTLAAYANTDFPSTILVGFLVLVLTSFALAYFAMSYRLPPVTIHTRWLRWLDPKPLLEWGGVIGETLRRGIQVTIHIFEGEGALLWTLLFLLFIIFALT
jgi:hypothetical protein